MDGGSRTRRRMGRPQTLPRLLGDRRRPLVSRGGVWRAGGAGYAGGSAGGAGGAGSGSGSGSGAGAGSGAGRGAGSGAGVGLAVLCSTSATTRPRIAPSASAGPNERQLIGGI